MIELVALIVVIGICAEAFTRTLDELGDVYGLDQHVIGSVFAAVATTLPETLVPLMALVVHHNTQIALGATVGSFLILSTLALAIIGIVLRLKKGVGAQLHVPNEIHADLKWFIAFCSFGLILSFLHNHHIIQVTGAVVLLGLYAARLRGILKKSKKDRLQQKSKRESIPKKKIWILASRMFFLIVALTTASSYFVDALHQVHSFLGNELMMALVFSPLATELPEKLNSILWVLRGRETAAIANITGALVYQASVLTAINILIGQWYINSTMILALIISMMATGILLAHKKWSWNMLAGESAFLLLFWMLQEQGF